VTGGKDKPESPHDRLVAQALLSLERRARQPGTTLTTPSVCSEWFRLKLGGYEHEVFAAAWLDTHGRLIAFEELFRETLIETSISGREVIKSALSHNAAAALFAHNHPSGSSVASSNDIEITETLGRALALVDVCLLDHFIVTAHRKPVSLLRVTVLVERKSKRSAEHAQSGKRRR
jgi:DNA repair protein RadC